MKAEYFFAAIRESLESLYMGNINLGFSKALRKTTGFFWNRKESVGV